MRCFFMLFILHGELLFLWHVMEPLVWQVMVVWQCGSGVRTASRQPVPRPRAQTLEALHPVGEEVATRREGVARTTPAVQHALIEYLT